MATRAYIGIGHHQNFGNYGIKYIYLHFDGYPERMFNLLRSHFNTIKSAESLVDGGAIRSIDVDPNDQIIIDRMDESNTRERLFDDKEFDSIQKIIDLKIKDQTISHVYIYDEDEGEWIGDTSSTDSFKDDFRKNNMEEY